MSSGDYAEGHAKTLWAGRTKDPYIPSITVHDLSLVIKEKRHPQPANSSCHSRIWTLSLLCLYTDKRQYKIPLHINVTHLNSQAFPALDPLLWDMQASPPFWSRCLHTRLFNMVPCTTAECLGIRAQVPSPFIPGTSPPFCVWLSRATTHHWSCMYTTNCLLSSSVLSLQITPRTFNSCFETLK